jgi:hypothetical protein
MPLPLARAIRAKGLDPQAISCSALLRVRDNASRVVGSAAHSRLGGVGRSRARPQVKAKKETQEYEGESENLPIIARTGV